MDRIFEKTGYLLKCLMDNMTDHIYFKDLDSRFILVNKAFCEWVDLSSDQLIGKTDFDLFASAHAQEAFDDEQRIIETGTPLVGAEEKETWPDGRITWVSTTKMPLKNEAGQTIGTFGISRDITAHKEADFRAARYAEEVRHYAEKMKRINNEIQDDLRMAGELQKAFFPSAYPVFPAGAVPGKQLVKFHHYYHSGGLVGGDLCSIHKLSETEAGIFLCDVMGHGVRAALCTAIIRALVDDLSRTEKDPGRFLERMNEALVPVLRSSDEFIFATACCLVLDVSTGAVRMANAGHPNPVHLGADGWVGWCMTDPGLRGPALAVQEEAEYPTLELQVKSGDAVILFTDGLFEVAGGNNEEYGEQRLLDSFARNHTLSLPELFPTILKEARLFAGDQTFDDDVCLVGFRLC